MRDRRLSRNVWFAVALSATWSVSIPATALAQANSGHRASLPLYPGRDKVSRRFRVGNVYVGEPEALKLHHA